MFRASIKKGKKSEEEWKTLFEKYTKQFPDLAKQYIEWMSGDLPKGWEKSLPVFAHDEKPMATRASSGKVLNAIAPSIPNLIEGSADLHPSTNTYFKNYPAFSSTQPEGRNLHYGIREHAMGGITNGISLHGGLIPLCSTFLVFADYMRPTMRLAAIMGIRSIFVFTHDSIGVGEDGPTHQPIEQVMSLRLIPNIVVLRPADSNEVKASWKIALERVEGPTILILTRQNLPLLTQNVKNVEENVQKGAYVLIDEKNPDVIFIGTGSEIQWAVLAQQKLAEKKIKVKVVSMPSWELFDEQDQKYKESVLPKNVPRLSIEAGTTIGWQRYADAFVGIDHFGASAPGNKVMQEFGFTAENVVKQAQILLKKR
jgi:transketolase